MTQSNQGQGKPRPAVDVSRPETFGVHLEYMSSELHSIDRKLDHIGSSVASMLQTFPSTYASISQVQTNLARISELEADRNRHVNDTFTLVELAKQIKELNSSYDKLRGGFTWLQVFIGGLLVPLAALGVAVAKLLF